MKLSIGVVVSGVLSMLGSLVVLLFGLLMLLLGLGLLPGALAKPAGTPFPQSAFLVLSLTYFLPAFWGVATSIGLFRLKNWARISIVIFSVLLILMAVLGGLVSAFVTLPSTSDVNVDRSVMAAVRFGIVSFWAVLGMVGIWWVIFFNRAKVRAQFVAGTPEPGTSFPATAPLPGTAPLQQRARPVSITIIAGLLLLGCVFIPFNLLIHSPAIFFTRIITGPIATAYYLALMVLHALLGIGLLRLRPAARTLAIAYYAFGLANVTVFYAAPGARDRLTALVSGMSWNSGWMQQMNPPPAINPMAFAFIGAVFGAAFMVVPMYFLITRKHAFSSESKVPSQNG